MTHHTRSTHSTDTQFAIRHKCFTLSGFGQYKEGIGTLKANGGDIGGGSEVLVCSETVGALCQVDCKGIGKQYVEQGKLVIMEANDVD